MKEEKQVVALDTAQVMAKTVLGITNLDAEMSLKMLFLMFH